MRYFSTRGEQGGVESSRAIAAGLAGDGGLYVPESFPALDYRDLLSCGSYAELSARVMSAYLSDFSSDELNSITKNAYADNFTVSEIAPVKTIGENYSFLELFHGPTLAFKDMALQVLPRLMPLALAKQGEKRKVFVLVATSGDTGKAALEGFKDVEGTAISVFYPVEGVSNAQKRQMITQEGSNVHVCAVNGNFDDAQTGVKKIFSDKEIAKEFDARGYMLSSANSINWGRLVPQIAYYFHAYTSLIKAKTISDGEKINFVVPTGNFGNILAGYYAKRMGLPINKLICASNANNVLTEFFNKGVYDKDREFFKTASPSMDILISSNLERLLFEMTGRDSAKVAEWMNELKAGGKYEIGEEIGERLKEDFCAYWCGDERSKVSIREMFSEKGYLMDTHTAVAKRVYDDYIAETKDSTHSVIVSTASAFKFAPDVLSAIDANCGEAGDEFAWIEALSKKCGVVIPEAIAHLSGKPVLHGGVCEIDNMRFEVLSQIQ